MNNILEDGSYLQKLANMHGFFEVKQIWDKNAKNVFQLAFVNDDGFYDIMRGCQDLMRPVSTSIEITFKIDGADDSDIRSNERLFDLIAETAEEDKLDIIAGKALLWPKDVSKDEMMVKLDLFCNEHENDI